MMMLITCMHVTNIIAGAIINYVNKKQTILTLIAGAIINCINLIWNTISTSFFFLLLLILSVDLSKLKILGIGLTTNFKLVLTLNTRKKSFVKNNSIFIYSNKVVCNKKKKKKMWLHQNNNLFYLWFYNSYLVVEANLSWLKYWSHVEI